MIAEVTLPLLALIGAGWLLSRWRRADPGAVVDVVLYLFMPLLMFTSLVRDPVTLAGAGRYLGWYAGFTLCSWGAATILGHVLRWPRPARGALGLIFTGINVGSYGIPVILFVVGEQALAGGMLLMVASNAAAGTLGVYLAAGGHRSPKQAALSIFRLPLIYGVIAALVVQLTGLAIPANWLDTAHHIGMAGPTVSLVVLGLQLGRIDWSSVGARIWAIAVGKLAVGTVVGVLLATWLGATGDDLTTLALMGCLPTAINSVLLAVHFDASPDLVGGACLATTLLSPLALITALAWLGQPW
jgi:malate permease and related proteins